MIGHFAAAVALKNIDAELFQVFSRCKHTRFLRTASDSERMRMLEQEQIILLAARNHIRLKLLLQIKRICVANATEPSNF